MRDVCSLIWLALIGLFRSRASLQAEILTLRHQLKCCLARTFQSTRTRSRREQYMLIGVGSRRRSASQAIDLPSDGGDNLGRLFTPGNLLPQIRVVPCVAAAIP